MFHRTSFFTAGLFEKLRSRKGSEARPEVERSLEMTDNMILAITLSAMAAAAVVMGRILFWVDGSAIVTRLSRKAMGVISWDYEEIKASLIGIWYYIVPLCFIAGFCAVFRYNIFRYFYIAPEYLGYIPLTILAEMSIVTMMSGSLTLFSEKNDWAGDIGEISWIQSIRKRNKKVAPLVPLLGALFEETFFRGTIFMILYMNFPILGFAGAAAVSGILFALEQALFTSSGRQCLSMVLASLGISFVACVSTAYTGSFLPCLLAHECFLIFYFGRFRYY